MINVKSVKRYCSEDICNIKNYIAAVTDKTQTWDCHHKLEMFLTVKELIDIERYYNVPARELVFLKRKEHCQWPHKGNAEARTKKSVAHIGKCLSARVKEKIGAALKGNTNVCGYKWWNNGVKTVRAKECPIGFKKGRL